MTLFAYFCLKNKCKTAFEMFYVRLITNRTGDNQEENTDPA